MEGDVVSLWETRRPWSVGVTGPGPVSRDGEGDVVERSVGRRVGKPRVRDVQTDVAVPKVRGVQVPVPVTPGTISALTSTSTPTQVPTSGPTPVPTPTSDLGGSRTSPPEPVGEAPAPGATGWYFRGDR